MTWIDKLAGDRSDPAGMAAAIIRFLESLNLTGYSLNTIENWGNCLAKFSRWCAECGIGGPQDVTREVLERYRRHVEGGRRVEDGQPLSYGSKSNLLSAVRALFRWLAKYKHIASNPAAILELPRKPPPSPRQVMSSTEAERVLNAVDLGTFIGLRDRAMMEVLYATGIRRSELCSLKMPDVDMERGRLHVGRGKCYTDRALPVNERALFWLEKYLAELRPLLVWRDNNEYLFLTREGRQLQPGQLARVLREHVKRARIGKSGACHIFRQAMAAMMLEGGTDIDRARAMLGLESVRTTLFYAQGTGASHLPDGGATHSPDGEAAHSPNEPVRG